MNKLDEFNKSLKNKKVLILGIGVSNLPLVDYLIQNQAQVFINDVKTIDKLDQNIVELINKHNIPTTLGEDYLNDISGFDIIFRSPSILPSIKPLADEIEKKVLVTTEIEMLMKLVPSKIIGITGSDGKQLPLP